MVGSAASGQPIATNSSQMVVGKSLILTMKPLLSIILASGAVIQSAYAPPQQTYNEQIYDLRDYLDMWAWRVRPICVRVTVVLEKLWSCSMNSARQKLIHEVDRDGNVFYLVSAFIGALNKIGDALIRNGDGLAAKIDANQKEIRQLMSALSDAVQAVADDVTRISDDVGKVLDLLTQPNPDVEAAVTALQAVDSGLDDAAAKLEAVIPPAPPVG